MKRHSHLISVGLMMMAFVIAAREYYINYQLDTSVSSVDFPNSDEILSLNSVPLEPTSVAVSEDKVVVPVERYQTLKIEKGDTLTTVLGKLELSAQDIESVTKALKGRYNPRDLKTGQSFSVKYRQDQEGITLLSLEFKPTLEHHIAVERNVHGKFKVEKKAVELKKVLRRVDGTIGSSFYNAALKMGIPAAIVKEAITALSYTINFQHGIRNGDPFELLYEEYQDAEGKCVKTGSLKYISVIARGQLHRIYYYAPPGKMGGYYNARGESVVRSLLQTPIDPSRMRITSKFGSRVHPIKGFRRDHKGVDFGAPHGTAVMAAGDGVVVKAGYFGDYGNYVRIRHAGGYETVYAHLSKISPNVRVGTFVKQRQVIGNVGATGLATGPHLHHEVIHKNVHINPQSVKALPSVQLAAKDLQKFSQFKNEIETKIVGLPMKNQLAQGEEISITG